VDNDYSALLPGAISEDAFANMFAMSGNALAYEECGYPFMPEMSTYSLDVSQNVLDANLSLDMTQTLLCSAPEDGLESYGPALTPQQDYGGKSDGKAVTFIHPRADQVQRDFTCQFCDVSKKRECDMKYYPCRMTLSP
jgi:hypothetical protein